MCSSRVSPASGIASPRPGYRSLSGPSGLTCPRSVPKSVKRGVSEGVSEGVPPEPAGPRAPECPKGVPTVSGSVRNTFLTLRRHSWSTFWTLRSPGPEGPCRHSLDTSGPNGPRDSCYQEAGGSQLRNSNKLYLHLGNLSELVILGI